MKRMLVKIAVIIAMILLAGVGIGKIGGQRPQAKQGVINLTGWNMQDNSPLMLNGQWDFYWNEWVGDAVLEKRGERAERQEAKVPGVWNGIEIEGERLPGFGFATYRLKVVGVRTDQPLALRIDNASTAFVCYVNQERLAGSGELGKSASDSVPGYKPQTVSFYPPASQFDIIIHVSNFTYARGGLWYPVTLGTTAQMESRQAAIIYKDALIIGSLFFMTIFFLLFYVVQREASSVYFIWMTLLLILRTSLYGDYLIVRLLPDMPFRVIVFLTYLTIIWFAVVMYRMIVSVVRPEKGDRMKKWIFGYALAATIMTAAAPVEVYTRFTAVYEAAAFATVVYALCILLKAYREKIEYAGILVFGGIIILSCGIHDVFYQANIVNNPIGELTSLALVFFMYQLSFVIVKRYAKLYESANRLTQQLNLALEEEKKMSEKLGEADRLKDEFMANTSHEIKTPLNGIINITQSILQDRESELSLTQRQNMEAVYLSAQKLQNLINDLLDVSILKMKALRLERTAFDLSMVVQNAVLIVKHGMMKQAVGLINHVSDDMPWVYADEARVHQIVLNILNNAMKFTNHGSVGIYAEVRGECMVVSVEDTGIGMSAEAVGRAFDAFEQVDGSIRRHYGGMGLGLYITRQLVELHGGEINIESEVGGGTKVWFTLPLAQEKESDEGKHKKRTKYDKTVQPQIAEQEHAQRWIRTQDQTEHVDILVVDDDRISLAATCNLLQLGGYGVVGLSNPQEALTLVKGGMRWEMMILDVMMPEISGYDLLETVRSRQSPIEMPVILLTAKSPKSDLAYGFSLGANDYLAKPFESHELMARVNNLMEMKKAAKQMTHARYAFLQAQIKPHFIYNALSVIASLTIKEPEKAKTLILDLSDYLRGSFDITEEQGLTTMKKELELVRAYVSIEQARFKSRLAIQYDLDDQIDIPLPLASIQPLVENAIRHGILQKEEGGWVEISIYRQNGGIQVSVKDNGVGMDRETIDMFLSGKPIRRGVGINNIHQRLVTMYGKGLSITSTVGKGTEIGFSVPIQ